MSKKQQDLDYSFITPPAQPTQSSSSSHSVPSAPIADNSVPPSYEDATVPTATNAFPIPPRNNTNLNGYVLDSSSAPFNPNVGMPMPESINLTNRQEINSGDYAPYADSPVDQPMLGEFESRHEEYDNFAGRPAPPGYSLYRAKYLKTKSGVVSRDHHINSDGEALLQFLYQHNQCPRMKINFYGYHEETQWKTVTRQNSNGEHVHDRESETRRIDDFNFTMDASSYISQVCQGIYILPDPKTGEVKPLRELCNDYVHEKNLLKELKLTKEVNWDFTGLTRGLTTAIRNSGFYENVEIRFTFENDEVVVKTDHYISRWIDNKYIRFFFFITFLWIITWPIIWLTRKTFGHKTLKSAWNMNVSERDWYGLHVQEAIDACRGSNAFQRGNTNFTPPYIQFNGVFR